MGVGHVTSGHRGSKALVGAFVGGTSVVAALASPTPALALDLTTPQLATQDGSPSFAQGLLTCAPLVREQPSRVDVSGATANASQLRPLDEAIGAIEGQGHQVGFVMVDLGSGATVSYHADDAFYSASSIKGPYVVSVVQNVLGDGAPADGRIDAILRYSDNDAYASFRSSYTDAPMHALVDASGAEQMANSGITEVVEASAAPAREGGIADNFYEFVTPRQLAAHAPRGLVASARGLCLGHHLVKGRLVPRRRRGLLNHRRRRCGAHGHGRRGHSGHDHRARGLLGHRERHRPAAGPPCRNGGVAQPRHPAILGQLSP